MQMFLITLLKCSAAMSIISLVFMLTTPLLSKRYSAKWLYYTWLVVVIGWIFPFRPHLDPNIFPFQIPNIQVIEAQYLDLGGSFTIIANETSGASTIPLWWVIAGIWIIGLVVMVAYNAWQHRRFLKIVKRWSEDVTNQRSLDILDDLRRQIEIKKKVGLKICHGIPSPMMIGFFRPVILLPTINIASDELTFILKHELVHLKRNDLWYKATVLLATTIHWFNPVIHIMAKAIAIQCEVSCDELLLQETSLQQRKQYGETIIGVIRNGTRLQTALSTDFYREKRGIKTRILRIMDTTKKKAGVSILCVLLIAILGSGTTFASNLTKIENNHTALQAEQELVGPPKTKQIINVDVKALESGKFVCFGGPYTFAGGEIIQYDITADGNNGNLTVKFIEANREPLQELVVVDCPIQNSDHRVKVDQSQAGSYWLLIGDGDGGSLRNIKGTIEIIAD